MPQHDTPSRARSGLLATTAVALALAFVGGAHVGGAQAQVTPADPRPAAQSNPDLPRALPNDLQQAEEELRVAHQQMGTAQDAISPQALQRARLALEGVARIIDQQQPGRLTEGATQALQQRVDQARRRLAAENPDALQARLAIDEVLAALPPVRAAMRQGMPGTPETGANARTAPASSGGGASAAAARSSNGVDLARVSELVGTDVVGTDGRDAGEVENLLIDSGGQVRAAVVEWGGVFGLGARRAVVPIDRLMLGAPGERVRMELTRQELEGLPRYEANRLADYGSREGWGVLRTYR
ncbi:PRC-barrel domain-containing protein [Falsiroseomonas tokyonensis]|uniref:PRC-barrel domain-containing protein n=1 Tax=Falsiroseomonas tokyonensis TaxID=430521 RepID=A0ABV7BV21_9PROT|nr:PRC-barrel domain-containing protein [Falsiroseomonas tokyonensis]MBU8539504.1 PRC-barrel domain-containing protein [Falsiroseomonas tokyonensis]